MSIKYAILGLLQSKDLHGYRIKQLLERDFGFMWTANYGQIYPSLKKLQQDEFLTMREIPQPASPPRKLYSITPKGKKEFIDWLNSSPEKGLMLRDPFLLRFPFFGFGNTTRALEIIDEQISLYEGFLKARQDNLSERRRSGSYGRLVAELGIELNEVMYNWLKHARKELSESNLLPDEDNCNDDEL